MHCHPLCRPIYIANTWVEECTAQLESITINGTMPDDTKPVYMAILRDLLKDGWECTKDLRQACLMAQSLMSKKVKDIERQ